MWRETPIYKLFFAPRRFFARHASSFPLPWIVIFSVFYGIERNFDQVFEKAVPLEGTTLFNAIALNVVNGAALGVSMIWVASWIFAWAARALGGAISSETMRKVLAWSALPKAPMVFAFAFVIAVQGERFFTEDRTTQAKSAPGLILGVVLLEIILNIWSIVIGVIGVSEMGRLSVLRAFGATLLGGVLLMIPVGAMLAVFAVLR